ncbi:11S globulin seed storage protein 2-like [Bidens hawaiensis]|uniref:11S globulin seed storage protein 2-like n=1 Tax=Bidens hawaiensis TaxID=980011 RepID=UPI0040495725
MVSKSVLIGFFLCLLGTTTFAATRSGGPEVCDIQQLTTSQPAERYDFEGGSVELWDIKDQQFQCIGAFPSRITVQPGSLQLPSFHHFPLLVFVQQGEGVMGIHFPGCAETYDSGGDSYQKEFRVKQGDVIAIPAGAVHWAYNNGNKDSVSVIINDLSNPSNQMDMIPRTFHLAGVYSQHQGHYYVGNSILNGFDTALLAEAFNANPEAVRAMQMSGGTDAERGFIVKVQEPMLFDDRQLSNGLEEQNICTSKAFYNLDSQREADIFSRQAGKVNTVNKHKLPLLSYLDLSAEKGYLQPNALLSPLWSTNSHTMLYVLSGDAQIETVSNHGEAVFDQKVSTGDIVVVPQFFVSTARAGENGFEWVAFKTNKSPMKSPLAGYTSVFRAMPLDVITNAYQMSPKQAQNLKTNRETESILFSPQTKN